MAYNRCIMFCTDQLICTEHLSAMLNKNCTTIYKTGVNALHPEQVKSSFRFRMHLVLKVVEKAKTTLLLRLVGCHIRCLVRGSPGYLRLPGQSGTIHL